MEVNPVQLSVLGVLFFVFLMIPTLANTLGDTLDTLPMRLAGVLLILGSVSYDKYVAIAVFLVVAAFPLLPLPIFSFDVGTVLPEGFTPSSLQSVGALS